MKAKLFHSKTTFLFILLIFTSVSFWSQKTLQFRVSRIGSNIADMDSIAGESDPTWAFKMEDLTCGKAREDTIIKVNVNCPGTIFETFQFFSEDYYCSLPENYNFHWSAFESDTNGTEANTGLETIPFTDGLINPNQSTWASLMGRTNYAVGSECNGGNLVRWQIVIEYRVLGTYFNNVEANFGVTPKLGCSIPHSTTFTDSSTNANKWLWDFGDGNTSTVQNPVHNYIVAGVFPISLTITDSVTKCSDIHYDTVSVSNPTIDFIGNPLFGCGPLTSNFTDQSASDYPINSWEWSFGNGDTSIIQNPNYTYLNSGNYTVRLTITDSIGCQLTKTKLNYVQVIGPDVNFGVDTLSGCSPLTINFTDSTNSTANITSWNWDFGDGKTSPSQNPSNNYIDSGSFDVSLTVTDIDGCSRTYSKSNLINIQKSYNDTVFDTICSNDSYILPSGTSINTPGIFKDTFSITNGCDSIITSIITVNDTSSTTIYDTICANQTYTLPNGTIVFSTGTYKDTLFKQKTGCDSIVTSYLFVEPISLTNVYDTICANETYTLPGGNITNIQGTHIDTIPKTITGCDSIITTYLHVFDTSSVIVNVAICKGETYTLPKGNITDTTGQYIDTLQKEVSGCDSIIITNLFVNDTSNIVIFDTTCANEPYTLPDGTSVTTAGIYTDTIPKLITGCDSIITIHLHVNSTSNTSINDTICNGTNYVLPSGKIVNIPGVYSDTIPKQTSGCDSIISIDLFVRTTTETNIYDTICNDDFYTLPKGTIVNITGIYKDTLIQSSTGCDSIVTTNLFVFPLLTREFFLTICEGDSILFDGQYQKTPGSFADTSTSNFGCEVITIVTLSVNPKSFNTVYDSICFGDSIFVGGNSQKSAGIYFDTLTNINGCDSILETVLFIKPPPIFNYSNDTTVVIGEQVELFVTSGYTYSWSPANSLTCSNCATPIASPLSSTIYELIVSLNGCDSTKYIEVIVIEKSELFIPNIFSPNGDESNDVFLVRGRYFKEFSMNIYNRWGEKVFYSDDYLIGWNGLFKGKKALLGAYSYIIEGVDYKDNTIFKKGSITLIR